MKLADNEGITKRVQWSYNKEGALGTAKTDRRIETDFQWEKEKQEAKKSV